MNDLSIIVVGAGPVGLLTTLRLVQAGIPTTCMEALDAIDNSPRAMAYHPIAVKELDRAGVLDDARRRGQHLLAEIILDHLKRYEKSNVMFGRKVTAIDQSSGDDIKVTVEDSEGKNSVLSADYVVAADGGRSTLRRLLDISFDGFTYEEQLVSTNVYYDFEKYGWFDGNFCVDPQHWALVARIDNEGLWRVSYGEKSGLSHAEICERHPWKFSELFPGDKPPNYKLDQMSPYRLNQRCASTFRKDRVVLAGDAAHLCSPFGGLGLCGGILDSAAVSDSLIGIHQGKASDAILDKYAEVRRQIFVDTVNPTSQANKMRMQDGHPETLGERDPFLNQIRNATPEEKQRIRGNAKPAVDMSEYFDLQRGQQNGV